MLLSLPAHRTPCLPAVSRIIMQVRLDPDVTTVLDDARRARRAATDAVQAVEVAKVAADDADRTPRSRALLENADTSALMDMGLQPSLAVVLLRGGRSPEQAANRFFNGGSAASAASAAGESLLAAWKREKVDSQAAVAVAVSALDDAQRAATEAQAEAEACVASLEEKFHAAWVSHAQAGAEVADRNNSAAEEKVASAEAAIDRRIAAAKAAGSADVLVHELVAQKLPRPVVDACRVWNAAAALALWDHGGTVDDRQVKSSTKGGKRDLQSSEDTAAVRRLRAAQSAVYTRAFLAFTKVLDLCLVQALSLIHI